MPPKPLVKNYSFLVDAYAFMCNIRTMKQQLGCGDDGSARKGGCQVSEVFSPGMVKAHFIMRGTSLKAWAREHGFDPGSVSRTLRGKQGGKVGRRIAGELRKVLAA